MFGRGPEALGEILTVDEMAYVAATALLLLAALAASLRPARRAATADPTQALRAE